VSELGKEKKTKHMLIYTFFSFMKELDYNVYLYTDISG